MPQELNDEELNDVTGGFQSNGLLNCKFEKGDAFLTRTGILVFNESVEVKQEDQLINVTMYDERGRNEYQATFSGIYMYSAFLKRSNLSLNYLGKFDDIKGQYKFI